MPRAYRWQFDESRYKRALLFGRVSEAKVQTDIILALARFNVQAQVVDAGGAALRGCFFQAMLRAGLDEKTARHVLTLVNKVSTAQVGHSDLSGILAPTGQAFFLEVKQPSWLNPSTGGIIRRAAIPSPEQLNFLDFNAQCGAICGVCWSLEDAIETLGLDNLNAHRLAYHRA
jgi:hypothetical protein